MKNNSFQLAQDWKYDRYEMQLVRGNRWQVAFIMQSICSITLVIALITLLPLKSIVPVVVHQNQKTGVVWIEQAKKNIISQDQAAIESDLVRYVINRETFSLMDFKQRYREIFIKTSEALFKKYQDEQSIKNKKSLINLLGAQGLRIVKIEDVIFIDKVSKNKNDGNSHRNLAKIDFVTIDEANKGTIQKHWVATMSWEYRGTPDQKDFAWENWNGFLVTYYRVDQRNV